MKKWLKILRNGILENKINLIITLIYIIVPLIVFSDAIASNQIMISGDGIDYMVRKDFLKDTLLSGEIPLWNRFTGGGTPFIADTQNAAVYPFTWLMTLFPQVLGSILFFTSHLSLAGIFMYLYLKEIKIGRVVAFVGGLIFMFSNILIMRQPHVNIYATIIWVPLILLYVERFLTTEEIKNIIFATLVMMIQFFASFPQVALYSDIFVGLYLLLGGMRRKLRLKDIIKGSFILIIVYGLLICIQLIPLIELMNFSGRNKVPYSFFSILSYDFRSIVLSLFPTALGAGALFLSNNSGMDVELYIGIVPLILFLYGLIYHRKEKVVIPNFLIMLGAYTFAICGSIPALGKMFYNIPLIGSFRCPSRVIFVFVICLMIISFISLNKIVENSEYKRYLKFSLLSLIAIMIVSGVWILVAETLLTNEIYKGYYGFESKVFYKSILMAIINFVLAGVLYYFYNSNHDFKKRIVINIVIVGIGVITIFDVYKFNVDSFFEHLKTTRIDSDVFKSEDVTYLKKQDDIDKYRTMLLFNDINRYYETSESMLSGNNNLNDAYMKLDGYITFNNPALTKLLDVAGMTYIPNATQLMEQKHDILSMLGVKYFALEKSAKQPVKVNLTMDGNFYINDEDISIPYSSQEVFVWEKVLDFEKDTYYLIEAEVRTDISQNLFYVDFYGENYDNVEQDAYFDIQSGVNKVKAIIYTGENELPDDTFLRIVSIPQSDIIVSKFKVSRLDAQINQDGYIRVNTQGDFDIYLNNDAQPIIYAPEKIISIDDDNVIYEANELLDLRNTNYILNYKNVDLSNVDVNIEVEEIRNNEISANVTASGDTFINMTQAWYPGWKAYVDNRETEIYIVNGVIQGIEVPVGEHKIEFKYESRAIKMGGIITLGTIGCIVIYLIKNKQRT